MDDRAELAWLARRVGFGLSVGQLDAWERQGVGLVLDELTNPHGNDVPPATDPFAQLPRDRATGGAAFRDAVASWFAAAAQSPRPLETWMQFFWHDFFAVSARVVQVPGLVYDHFALLNDHALGNFGALLRAVTTDGAMLTFLDGRTSTGTSPNENYGRELLELYSVGIGSFTEDDVLAASVALTGWTVARRTNNRSIFVARRHDDTPQTLLGVDVHDVDGVIDVVAQHPATHARVTGLLAQSILGSDVEPALVTKHAARFSQDLNIASLVRGLLEDGLDGAGGDVIIGPVGWTIAAAKATGAFPKSRIVGQALRSAGQVPLFPPNVGGFPPALSYLSASATVARLNLAWAFATAAEPGSPALVAANERDIDGIAEVLGLVGGFNQVTRQALERAEQPVEFLAAALASPDMIVARSLNR